MGALAWIVLLAVIVAALLLASESVAGQKQEKPFGLGAVGGEAVDPHKLHRELYSITEAGRRLPITTPEQWQRKREEIRQRVFDLIGELPTPRCPLNAQVVKEDTYHGLIRRLVQYDVEPGDTVRAWLLVPKGVPGRQPALVCRHQTVHVGKDEPIGWQVFTKLEQGQPRYRTIAEGEEDSEGPFYALKYAMKGYVTLAFDEVTAGDRISSPKGPFYTDAFYERHPHWKSFAAKSVFDGMRAVDYLQSLPFVDPQRIGITGHSLGGFTTAWQMALDERLQAGSPSCGYQLWQANFSERGALAYSRTQWFIYIPALRPCLLKRQVPFDYHELLALIAPRRYLDTGADNDDCCPQADQNTLLVDLLKDAYAFYYPADRLRVIETRLAYPGRPSHGRLYPLRVVSYDGQTLYGRLWHFGGHGYTNLQFEEGLRFFDQAFGIRRAQP